MFNKSQIKALVKLKKVSENEFKRFANPEPSSPMVEPQARAHSQPFIKNAKVGNSDKYRSEFRWSHISSVIIVCLKLGAMPVLHVNRNQQGGSINYMVAIRASLLTLVCSGNYGPFLVNEVNLHSIDGSTSYPLSTLTLAWIWDFTA